MPRTLLILSALLLAGSMSTAEAKDRIKVGFIGPLTGGVSVNGIGGRNSADLAVKLRNADAKAKDTYDLVVLDDEFKPNVAVQVATKMAADRKSSRAPRTIALPPQSPPSTPITNSDFR